VTVRDATTEDLEVVATWVGSEDACRLWGGPAVSFPLSPARLEREITFRTAENLALADEAGCVGFGQVIMKDSGRAHLARVIVRPDARGRGMGRTLVRALVERASRCGARVASLNVYATNEAARRIYAAEGFVEAPWPADVAAAPADVLHLTLEL
jgi:ribosomal protein S18 acetylase RimI-like enzyme